MESAPRKWKSEKQQQQNKPLFLRDIIDKDLRKITRDIKESICCPFLKEQHQAYILYSFYRNEGSQIVSF